MPIITAQEINNIAFTEPIDSSTITEDIINAAEAKYIIPAITKTLDDDLSVHPDSYTYFITEYIKPYLAYCVKYLLYTQYFTESLTELENTGQRGNLVNEINAITQLKKTLLVNHLATGIYPLYVSSVRKRINGFLIK